MRPVLRIIHFTNVACSLSIRLVAILMTDIITSCSFLGGMVIGIGWMKFRFNVGGRLPMPGSPQCLPYPFRDRKSVRPRGLANLLELIIVEDDMEPFAHARGISHAAVRNRTGTLVTASR